MSAALFADISNLYYCVGKRFEGRKIDYKALYVKASEIGELQRAFAYGMQQTDEAVKFITCLKKLGYDTKYKQPGKTRRACWDVGIAMDVVRMLPRVSTIILGTANPDMTDLIRWVKDQGVRVVVLACGIPRELKDEASQYLEITEDLLEAEKAVTA
jgi:uncharacterized LabA/DUF88 family protein